MCVPDYRFDHHPGSFLPAGGKYRDHEQVEAVLQVGVWGVCGARDSSQAGREAARAGRGKSKAPQRECVTLRSQSAREQRTGRGTHSVPTANRDGREHVEENIPPSIPSARSEDPFLRCSDIQGIESVLYEYMKTHQCAGVKRPTLTLTPLAVIKTDKLYHSSEPVTDKHGLWHEAKALLSF